MAQRHREPVDVHLILRRGGEVLLSRRAGDTYTSGLPHMPSGHLDEDFEDVVTGLVREAEEELGVVIRPADVRVALVMQHRSPKGHNRTGWFFEVTRWFGVPRIAEPDRCSQLDWFALHDLPDDMVAYCRAGLDAYGNGHSFALHLQEPDDPIAYDANGPSRLHPLPARAPDPYAVEQQLASASRHPSPNHHAVGADAGGEGARGPVRNPSMTDVAVAPDEATRLRNKVVDQLKEDGTIVSPAVEAAMRKVPRHIAVPEASLSDAYSTYNAVATQEEEHGYHTSSVSAPQIQAMQLEQADIRPGDNVLEIGTNGPSAAYLAELVGSTGQVTTVDIDPAPADRARRFLAETGYTDVNVVVADAENGLPEHAPYDAIVVTVGAWDIPPAWTVQLKEDGRLVVPLRINGLTRTYSFVRQADHLLATSAHVCGFVAMQGAGSHAQQVIQLPGDKGVTLRFDEGLPTDPSLLDGVLDTARAETWTGVSVASQEPIGTLQMYLSTQVPAFCFMSTTPELATGKIGPTGNSWSMVAIDGPHFAYTVVRRDTEKKTAEYGVHAFGPNAAEFAERIADIFRTWGEKVRGTDGPRIAVYPAGTPDDRGTGDWIIDKKHSRISISWHPA